MMEYGHLVQTELLSLLSDTDLSKLFKLNKWIRKFMIEYSHRLLESPYPIPGWICKICGIRLKIGRFALRLKGTSSCKRQKCQECTTVKTLDMCLFCNK